MTQALSRITTDIDYARPGLQSGVLRIPHSVDRSGYGHIRVPIAVAGDGQGPTLLLTGGNHGDEYEGPVALMKLMQRLPSMAIKGRLIVVPGLNFPAFINGTRTSPIDKGNLNRLFPGRRDGSITEMIAHYVETQLLPLVDVAFDIHAGGASFYHLPTLLVTLPEDRALHARYKELVNAFGAQRAMVANLLGEDRTFAAAMARRGAMFLCGEFGGGAHCAPEHLAVVEQGIEGLMAALGMIDARAPSRPAAAARLLGVKGREHYIYASHAGIFEPAFRLGDEVSAGQLAGRIHDPHHPGQAPV